MAEERQEEILEETVEQTEETPEVNDWQDKYIRLYADFENYKKRKEKEVLSSYTNGKIGAVEELLSVVDNFDRALASIENDDSQFAQGIKMVSKQLYEALDKLGVKPIEALGKHFDPNLHNAVMHIEDESLGENVIAQVFSKGYKIGEKVLRPAMVKVAN